MNCNNLFADTLENICYCYERDIFIEIRDVDKHNCNLFKLWWGAVD